MERIFTVDQIPGVCSMLTIKNINVNELQLLTKEEFISLLKEQYDSLGLHFHFIKSVQFTLNEKPWWSILTIFKFAYSYKNRFGDKCSVFYINL